MELLKILAEDGKLVGLVEKVVTSFNSFKHCTVTCGF